jgi:catechol 2,3-dioxygenase-like lactoylglutathione lyase family enzyme
MSKGIALSGVHHVRIPVTALETAVEWFADLLGYQKDFPFKAEESVIGWALRHPQGGPSLALIQDPERAHACCGFPLLAFGVPNETSVRRIATRLDARGIAHGGVQPALVGVKLPFVKGPDGILFGFYVKQAIGSTRAQSAPPATSDTTNGNPQVAKRMNSPAKGPRP